MIRRVVTPTVAVACIALLAAAPTAGAQLPSTSFPIVPMRAATGGGAFTGRLALERFTVRSQGLVAVGHLTGTLKDRRYPSAQPIDRKGFSLAIAVAPVTGSADCARLAVSFAPRAVTLFGLRAQFPAATLLLRPHKGSPPAYRELLCGTAQSIGTQPQQPAVLHLLNAIRLLFG